MKISCLILSIIVFDLTLANLCIAHGKVTHESRELSNLSWLVSDYSAKNDGKLPLNWNDIWDEDEIVSNVIKSSSSSPIHERYWFVKDKYPMPSPYQGSLVEGEIIVLKKEPIEHDDHKHWSFLWVSDKGIGIGYLNESELEIGDGENQIRLVEPDVSESKLASLQNRLADLRPMSQSSLIQNSETTVNSEGERIIPSPSPETTVSKPSTVQETITEAEQESASFPWFWVGIAVITLGLMVFFLVKLPKS
ncbi:MAG: hypothetical protein AAGH72_09355 [Verrucomicrobiota bacterium]